VDAEDERQLRALLELHATLDAMAERSLLRDPVQEDD